MKHLRASLLGLALIWLSACGSDPEPDAAAAQANAAAKSPKVANDEQVAVMARAVGNRKPGAAVDIRYEFKGKPAVGAPIDLEVAIIPSVGVDSMNALISGMDGVSVTGTTIVDFANVDPGKPYTHRVTLLPDRNGVFYVTVTVTTEIGNSSLGRTYAIPFVVGDVQVTQKPAPARDAKGEPIESLPAKESSG
jgi:hypothetical protein